MWNKIKTTKLKCELNEGAYECFMQTECGRARLTNLNWYISEITDIDEKWFVIFEGNINHFSFG